MNIVCRNGDVVSTEDICVRVDKSFCVDCQHTVCICRTGGGDAAPKRSTVDDRICLERSICTADDLPVILKCCRGYSGICNTIYRSVVCCFFCVDGSCSVRIEITGGLEIPVHIEGGRLRARDLTFEIDTEPFFRSNQCNPICIHTADCRKIEGIGGRVAVRSDGGDCALCIADCICACDKPCALCPKPCVDFDSTCIEFSRIYALCTQTVSCNDDFAVVDAQRSEVSCGIHLCASCGKCYPCRIQKTGTICQNPVRIGNNDTGPVTCDL